MVVCVSFKCIGVGVSFSFMGEMCVSFNCVGEWSISFKCMDGGYGSFKCVCGVYHSDVLWVVCVWVVLIGDSWSVGVWGLWL